MSRKIRLGLQPRVFSAVVFVALGSSVLTGLLIRNRTMASFRQAEAIDLVAKEQLTTDLGAYPGQYGSWEGVQDTVTSLAETTGLRVVLTDNKRNVIADSDPGLVIPTNAIEHFQSNDTRLASDDENTPTYAPTCFRASFAKGIKEIPEEFEHFSDLAAAIREPDDSPFGQAMQSVPEEEVTTLTQCLAPYFDSDGEEAFLYVGEGKDPRLHVAGLSPLSWLGLVAAGLGFAAITAALVARRITRPLRALTSATASIQEGALTNRVEVAGKDEVAVLGNAFNDMASRLEQVEKQRSQLVRDLAHELRNPLGVLQGSIEAAIDGVVPLTDESLGMLHGEVRHLSDLVNDLAQLASFDAGSFTISPRSFDLTALVHHVLDPYRAKHPGLRFVVDAEDLEIFGDRTRLRQVLANLIRNATQHTPDGGTVTATVKRVASTAAIAVSDTGHGMNADQVTHVFDRFWRADDARRRDGDDRGSGLGLSICKAIVESHGGQLSVQSTPEVGTTFFANLPVDGPPLSSERNTPI